MRDHILHFYDSFGNPSSGHFEGRKARQLINQVREYLHQLFGLAADKFLLIFHSGATEGTNLIIQSLVQQQDAQFFYSPLDHAVARNLARSLQQQRKNVALLELEANGDLKTQLKLSQKSAVLNFLPSHNEVGIVWPYDWVLELKEKYGVWVHVDAVQVPGKIKNWEELPRELDAYTFSGHKFGALKGIGFSFVRKDLPLQPLFFGGGQQGGLRPGTENALGIATLMWALEELKEQANFEQLVQAKSYLLKQLKSLLADKIIFPGEQASFHNGNTIGFLIKGQPADFLAARLDQQGIAVGTGSACSAGSLKPNPILQALGFSEAESKQGLRISLPVTCQLEDAKQYWQRLEPILQSIK